MQLRRFAFVHRPLAVALVALLPGLASAQILSLPSNSPEPGNWLGAGVSVFQGMDLRDDSRSALLGVNGVTGYRVSIEKGSGNGTSLGAAVSFSQPSITVSNLTASGPCATACAATAQFIHYQLVYRSGTPTAGTSGVAELAIGGLRIGDLRSSTGTALAPDRTILSLAAGFGFAFAPNPRLQFEIVQEYTQLFAGGGFTGAATQWRTRVGARIGVGSRD